MCCVYLQLSKYVLITLKNTQQKIHNKTKMRHIIQYLKNKLTEKTNKQKTLLELEMKLIYIFLLNGLIIYPPAKHTIDIINVVCYILC